jgi:hypothetical protein
MGAGVRWAARIALGILTVTVIVFGTVWAKEGTTSPTVYQGDRFGDLIVIRMTGEDFRPISFTWWLTSDGRVTMQLNDVGAGSAISGMGGWSSPDSFKVVVYLYCGARLDFTAQAEPVTQAPESVVESSGQAECGAAKEAPAMAAPHHIVTLGPHSTVSGTPRGGWIAEGTGQRVASVPGIRIMRANHFLYGILEGHDPPSPGSTVSTVVTSRPSEVVDLVQPESSSLTENGFEYRPSKPLLDGSVEFPSVMWTSVIKEQKDQYGEDEDPLRGGTARWTDAAGQQSSQQQTLGAGVLLGVGAALVIEMLFHFARGETRTTSDSRRASRRRRVGRPKLGRARSARR